MEDRSKNSGGTPKVIARKMLIITPEQMAKLGLTSKIRSIIAPQLKHKTIINRTQLKPQKPKQTRPSNWRRESAVDENEMKLKLNSRFKQLVSKKLPTDALEESSSAQLVKIKELITAPHKRGKKTVEPKPKPTEPVKIQLQASPAMVKPQSKFIKVILPSTCATTKAVPAPMKENKVVLKTQSIPNLSVVKGTPGQKIQIVRNEVKSVNPTDIVRVQKPVAVEVKSVNSTDIVRVQKPVAVEIKKEIAVKKPIAPSDAKKENVQVTLPSFSTFHHLAVNKFPSAPSKKSPSKVETKKSEELREELQGFISFQKAAKSPQVAEKKSSIPIATSELKRRLAKPMFVQFDPVTRKISKLEKGSPMKPLVLQQRVQENFQSVKEPKDTTDVSKIIGKKIHIDSVDISKMIKIELPASQELALRLAMKTQARIKAEPECAEPQASKVSDIFAESDESQTTYEVLEVQVMGSDSPEAEESPQVCRGDVKQISPLLRTRNIKLPKSVRDVKDRSKRSNLSRVECAQEASKAEVKSPGSQLKHELEELYEHELEEITANASKEASLEELALRDLGLKRESHSPGNTEFEAATRVAPEIEDPIEQALQKLHGVSPTPCEPAEGRNEEVVWESPENRGVVEDVETIENYITQSEIRQQASSIISVESDIEESSQETPDKVMYEAELVQNSEAAHFEEEELENYRAICETTPIKTEIVDLSAELHGSEVLLETPDEDRGFSEDKSLETHGRADLSEIENEVTSKSPLNRQPSESQDLEFEEGTVMFDIRPGESAEVEIHDAPLEAPENDEVICDSRSPKDSESVFEMTSLKTHDNDVVVSFKELLQGKGVGKSEESELKETFNSHRVISKSRRSIESEFGVTSLKTHDNDVVVSFKELLQGKGVGKSEDSELKETLNSHRVISKSRRSIESEFEVTSLKTHDKDVLMSYLEPLNNSGVGELEVSVMEEAHEKDSVECDSKSPRSRTSSESGEPQIKETIDKDAVESDLGLQRSVRIGEFEDSEAEETPEKDKVPKSPRSRQGSESEESESNESLNKDEVFDESELPRNRGIGESEKSEADETLEKAMCDSKSLSRRGSESEASETNESLDKDEIFADSEFPQNRGKSEESEAEERLENDKAKCDSKSSRSRQGSESDESESKESSNKGEVFSDSVLPNNRGLVESEDVSLKAPEVDKIICDSRSGEADIFYEEVVFSDSGLPRNREVEESEESKTQDASLETPEKDKVVCNSRSRQNSESGDSQFKETFDNYEVFTDSGLPRNRRVGECEESNIEDVILEAPEKGKVICDSRSCESREFVFEGTSLKTSNLGLPENLDTFESAEIEISEKDEYECASRIRRNSDTIEFEFEELSSETPERYEAVSVSPRTRQISTESESDVETPQNDNQTTASEPKEASMRSPEKLQDSEYLTADESNIINDEPESDLVQFVSEEVVEETVISERSPEKLQDSEYLTADKSNIIHDEPKSDLVQFVSEEVVEETVISEESEVAESVEVNTVSDVEAGEPERIYQDWSVNQSIESPMIEVEGTTNVSSKLEVEIEVVTEPEDLKESIVATCAEESLDVEMSTEPEKLEEIMPEDTKFLESESILQDKYEEIHVQTNNEVTLEEVTEPENFQLIESESILQNKYEEIQVQTNNEVTLEEVTEPENFQLIESESKLQDKKEENQMQTNNEVTLEEVTEPEDFQIIESECKLQDKDEEIQMQTNIEVILEESTEPEDFQIIESECKLQDKDEEIQMQTNIEMTLEEVTEPEDFQFIESDCKLQDKDEEIPVQTNIEVILDEVAEPESESKSQGQDVEIQVESNNKMTLEEVIDISCDSIVQSFEPSKDEEPEASRPLELDEATLRPSDETDLFEDILSESQIQSTKNLQTDKHEAALQEPDEMAEPKFASDLPEGVHIGDDLRMPIHDQVSVESQEQSEEIELQSSSENVQLGEEVEIESMEQSELQLSDEVDLFDGVQTVEVSNESYAQLSEENETELSKPENVDFAEKLQISDVAQIELVRADEDSQVKMMEDVQIINSNEEQGELQPRDEVDLFDGVQTVEVSNESYVQLSEENKTELSKPENVDFAEELQDSDVAPIELVRADEDSQDKMEDVQIINSNEEQGELQPSDDVDLFDGVQTVEVSNKSYVQLSEENETELSKPENVDFAEELQISDVPQIELVRADEDSQDKMMEDVQIINSNEDPEAGFLESVKAIIDSKELEVEEKVDSPKSVQFGEQIQPCVEQGAHSVEAIEDSRDLIDSQTADDETESYLRQEKILIDEEAINLSGKEYAVRLPEECAIVKSPEATEKLQEQHGKAEEITGMECTQVVDVSQPEVNSPSQFQSAIETRLLEEVDGSHRLHGKDGTELPEDLSLNPQRWLKHESQFECRNFMERSYNIDNYTGEPQRAETSNVESSPPKQQFTRRRCRTKPKVNLKSRLKRRTVRPPSVEHETKDDYSLIDMELEETLDNAVLKHPSPCRGEYVAINESEIPSEEIDMTGFVSDKEVNRYGLGTNEVIDYSSRKIDISKQYFSDAQNSAITTAAVLNSNLSEVDDRSESKAESSCTSKTDPDLESIRNEAKSLLYSFLTRRDREKFKSHSQDGSDTKKFKAYHGENKSEQTSNTENHSRPTQEILTSGTEETHNNVVEHSNNDISNRFNVTCESAEEFRKKRKRGSSQDKYRKRHFESNKNVCSTTEGEGQVTCKDKLSLPLENPIYVEEVARNVVDERVNLITSENLEEPRRVDSNDGSDFFIRNFEKSSDRPRRAESSSGTTAQNENTSMRMDFLDEGDHNHLLKEGTGVVGGSIQGNNKGTLEDCIVLPLEDAGDATSTSKENIVILRIEPLREATERSAEVMSDIQTLEAILSGSKTDKQTGDALERDRMDGVRRARIGRGDSEDEMSNILRYMTKENSKRSAFIEEQRVLVEKQKALDEAEKAAEHEEAGGSIEQFFREESAFLEQPEALASGKIAQKIEEQEKQLVAERAEILPIMQTEINDGQKDLLLGNDEGNILKTALEKEDNATAENLIEEKEAYTTAENGNESVIGPENLPPENAEVGTLVKESVVLQAQDLLLGNDEGNILNTALEKEDNATAENLIQEKEAYTTAENVNESVMGPENLPPENADVGTLAKESVVLQALTETENKASSTIITSIENTAENIESVQTGTEDFEASASCFEPTVSAEVKDNETTEMIPEKMEENKNIDSFHESNLLDTEKHFSNKSFEDILDDVSCTYFFEKSPQFVDGVDELSGTEIAQECNKSFDEKIDNPDDKLGGTDIVQESKRDDSESLMCDDPDDQLSGTDIVEEREKDSATIQYPDVTIEKSASAVSEENEVDSTELKTGEQSCPAEEVLVESSLLLQKGHKKTEVSIEADHELQKSVQEKTEFSIESSQVLQKSSLQETELLTKSSHTMSRENEEGSSFKETDTVEDTKIVHNYLNQEQEKAKEALPDFDLDVSTDRVVDHSCFDQAHKDVEDGYVSTAEFAQFVDKDEATELSEQSQQCTDKIVDSFDQVHKEVEDVDSCSAESNQDVNTDTTIDIAQFHKEVGDGKTEEFNENVGKDDDVVSQMTKLSLEGQQCTDEIVDSCFDQVHEEVEDVDSRSAELNEDVNTDTTVDIAQFHKEVVDGKTEEFNEHVGKDDDSVSQMTKLSLEGQQCTDEIVDSCFDEVSKGVEENSNDCSSAEFVQDVSKDESRVFQSSTLTEDSQTCPEKNVDDSCFDPVHQEDGKTYFDSSVFVQEEDNVSQTTELTEESQKCTDYSSFDQVLKGTQDDADAKFVQDASNDEDSVSKMTTLSEDGQTDRQTLDRSCFNQVHEEAEDVAPDLGSPEMFQDFDKDEVGVHSQKFADKIVHHSCFDQVDEDRCTNLSSPEFSKDEDNVQKYTDKIVDHSCFDQVHKEAEDGIIDLSRPEDFGKDDDRVSQASILSGEGEKFSLEIAEDDCSEQDVVESVTDFSSAVLVQNVSKDEDSISTTLFAESQKCTDHSCFDQVNQEVEESRYVNKNEDSVSQTDDGQKCTDLVSRPTKLAEVCQSTNTVVYEKTEEDAGIEEDELEGFEEDCIHEYEMRIKEITVKKISEEIRLLEDSIRTFVANIDRTSRESDDDVICLEKDDVDGISISSSEEVGPSCPFKIEIKKSASDEEGLSDEESIAMPTEASFEETAELPEETREDYFSDEESLGCLDVSLEVPDSEDESSPMGVAAASWKKGWPSLGDEIIAVSDEDDSSNKDAGVETSQRSKVEEGVFTLSCDEGRDVTHPTHNVCLNEETYTGQEKTLTDLFVDDKGVELNAARAEDKVVNPFFLSEEEQLEKPCEVEEENCQPPQVITVTDEAASSENEKVCESPDETTELTTPQLSSDDEAEEVFADATPVHLKEKMIKDRVNIFEVSSEESMSSVSVDEIPTISVCLGEEVQEENKTENMTEGERTENSDVFSASKNDGVVTMPERMEETPRLRVEAEKTEKFVDEIIASLKSQTSAASKENMEELREAFAVSDEEGASADETSSKARIEEEQLSEKVKKLYEVYAVSDDGTTRDGAENADEDETSNLEVPKKSVQNQVLFNASEDETSNVEKGKVPNKLIQNEVRSVSDEEEGSGNLKMSTSQIFENSEDSDTSDGSSGERETSKDTSDDDSEPEFELEIEDVSDEELAETREAKNNLDALKKDEDTVVVSILDSEESSSQSDPGNVVEAVKVENTAACDEKPEMDFDIKFVHKLDKARAGIKSLFEREDGSNSDSSESIKVKVEDDQRQHSAKKPLPNLIPIKAAQSSEHVTGIRKDLDMVDTITFKQVKKIFRSENRPQMVVPFVRSMFPERKKDLEAITSSLRRKFMEARSSLMTSSPDDTCTTPPPSPTAKRKKLNYSDKRLAAFLNSGRPKRVKKKPKWIIDNFHVDEDLFNYIEDNRKKDVDFKCIDPYRLSQLKLEMPGKRGRKRKLSESQTENATETDDGDGSIGESNPLQPKKRGRKKRKLSITIGDEKPTILMADDIKNEPADQQSDLPNPMPRISVVDVHKMLPKKRFVNLFCGNVQDAVPKTEKSPEPVKEEDTVKSEDTFVTPPIVKRGRGRPKKHATVVTPEPVETPAKRPRGRPRKNSNSLLSKSEKLDRIICDLKKNIHVDPEGGEEEDDTLSDGGGTGDPKRRRGRPSKLKEFVNNVILGPAEPVLTAVVVAAAETGPGTPETKRRRGRPPKKGDNDEQARKAADGEEIRKRERKSVDYTALNSGENDEVKEEGEATKMNDSALGEETASGSAITAKKEGDKKDGPESPLDLQNRILVTNYVEDIKQEMKISAAKHPDSEEPKTPGLLTCAICYKTMKQNDWSSHKRRSHNNLAWKLGADPMDLDNVPFVMYILNQAYKDRKPFFCEGCSESKKSVIGFLGHKIQCNKSPEQLEEIKIDCNICHRRVMPFSYVEHLRCHKVKEVKLAKQIEEQHRAEVVNSPKNASRKRGAAIKATEMIQSVTKDCTTAEKSVKKLYKKDIPVHDESYRSKLEEDLKKLGFVKCEGKDCTNITTTILNATEHYQSCILSLKKKYICKVCDESFDDKVLVWSHIETAHSDQLPAEITEYSADPKEAKYSDDEGEAAPKKRLQKAVAAAAVEKWEMYFPKFLDEQPYVKEISPFLNPATFTQTLEFYKLNFCKALYTHFFRKNTWTKLPTDDIVDYLPALKTSMMISEKYTKEVNYKKKTDAPTKNFKLFESEIKENGNSTIFCGGPISSLSWLPTPFELKNCDQVLAVSVLPDPDKDYYLTQTYRGANLIQFWSFGALSNDEASRQRPELMFCLAHDFGVVWSMAWCPSGCYGDGRLGLLAATCSDSNVHLFTVFQSKSNANKIFKPKPTISLVLNRHSDLDLGGTSYQATCLSWSKAVGHKYLAVGYSNGLVALFKLNVSNLSKYEDTQIVYPVHVFQAHRSVITTIALHHMNDGCKWLASGSADRIVKFWDLDNTSEPISQDYKKLQVGQLVWHINWLTVASSPGDVSNLACQATNLSHFRDFAGTVSNSILHTSAPVCGLSTCDWANIIVQGSMMGELTGCYVKNFAPFHSELNMRRYYISYNTIQPLEENSTESASEKRTTYKAATKGVKLEFNDVVLNPNQMSKPSDVTASVKSNFQEYDCTSYPLQSITVVQINPNRFSFLYTAAGYKAGFVRVSYSSFLSRKYS